MPFFKLKAKVEAWSTYIVEADTPSQAHDLWADESPASRCVQDCEPDDSCAEELYSINELAEHEGEAERALRQRLKERREMDRLGLRQMKLSDAEKVNQQTSRNERYEENEELLTVINSIEGE